MNGALMAIADTKNQLKELLDTYSSLDSLIDAYCPAEKKNRIKIFTAQMFLGSTYEIIKEFLGKDTRRNSRVDKLRKSNPSFNFFYHCRNASFHGNKFTFYEERIREFKKGMEARWKTYTIDESDEGKPLFTSKLPLTDVVSLIEDIEKLL